MSIQTTNQFVCDRCTYKDPNRNNPYEVIWVFTKDINTNKFYHFCSEYCFTYYHNCYDVRFEDKDYVGSKSKYFKNLVGDIS